MKGLFCAHCRARNNEEYREVLRKRLTRVWLVCIMGLLVALTGAVLFHTLLQEVGEYQQGAVYGMGVGLMLGAVVSMFRIRRVLADEGRLKEQRLKETDERELEIGSLALRQTAKLLLLALYILMVFGILVSEELLKVSCLLICTFLLSYIGFRRYYESKV